MSNAPIKIGYCLSLTGPLAANGQTARLAHEICEQDVNRRGDILGRGVELICVDDATDPTKVADIYKSLLDEDKVDLVLGGYGNNSISPAMPVVMEHEKFLVGLMGLGVNTPFYHPGYFVMIPTGPEPSTALTEGFFDVAARQAGLAEHRLHRQLLSHPSPRPRRRRRRRSKRHSKRRHRRCPSPRHLIQSHSRRRWRFRRPIPIPGRHRHHPSRAPRRRRSRPRRSAGFPSSSAPRRWRADGRRRRPRRSSIRRTPTTRRAPATPPRTGTRPGPIRDRPARQASR